ncbi:hypothetical protein BDW72DRAFT_197982 [Aspergillus terricola var. indicus]
MSSSSRLPTTQTAIIAAGPGKLTTTHTAPLPPLDPDMVLVKTAAVAINPADAKMLDYSAAAGAIHGYDFAGTVVALGSDAAAEGRFEIGDRVAGLVHGMNKLKPDVGAFAEYVGAYADLLLKIPSGLEWEQAATFGTGIATAMLAGFKELGVPGGLDALSAEKAGGSEIKDDEKEFVLVAGGSTATGTRALQLLKLAGLRPIATCSPRNMALALKFGAEKVFDYNSPNCASDIKAYTNNELSYVLDCVTQADTTTLAYAAMGRAGGRYVSLEPFRDTVAQTRALTIVPSWVMVLTIFGKSVALDGEYGREARPEDRAFGKRAFSIFQDLLDKGLVGTHPVKLVDGGWEGVCKAVDLVRGQGVSGEKVVCRVA